MDIGYLIYTINILLTQDNTHILIKTISLMYNIMMYFNTDIFIIIVKNTLLVKGNYYNLLCHWVILLIKFRIRMLEHILFTSFYLGCFQGSNYIYTTIGGLLYQDCLTFTFWKLLNQFPECQVKRNLYKNRRRRILWVEVCSIREGLMC